MTARLRIGWIRAQLLSWRSMRHCRSPTRASLLGRFWKYRVGDYRIIAEIQDREIRVLVVRIGHRREVYR